MSVMSVKFRHDGGQLLTRGSARRIQFDGPRVGADSQQLQGGTEAQSAGLVGESVLHGLRGTTQNRQDENRSAVKGQRLQTRGRTDQKNTSCRHSVDVRVQLTFTCCSWDLIVAQFRWINPLRGSQSRPTLNGNYN